jgi:inosine-uridine nucleoside N-ribohydrolase
LKSKKTGKPVIIDMDMSPGDFVSLIYLLKAPPEVIDLKVQLLGMAQCFASMQLKISFCICFDECNLTIMITGDFGQWQWVGQCCKH